VRFIENLSPVEAVKDEHGAVKAMRSSAWSVRDGKLVATGEMVELPARTVCVAAGTSPNVTYEREKPRLVRDRKTRRVLRDAPREGRDDGKLALEKSAGGAAADGRASSRATSTTAGTPSASTATTTRSTRAAS
jgi:hypothetical protein